MCLRDSKPCWWPVATRSPPGQDPVATRSGPGRDAPRSVPRAVPCAPACRALRAAARATPYAWLRASRSSGAPSSLLPARYPLTTHSPSPRNPVTTRSEPGHDAPGAVPCAVACRPPRAAGFAAPCAGLPAGLRRCWSPLAPLLALARWPLGGVAGRRLPAAAGLSLTVAACRAPRATRFAVPCTSLPADLRAAACRCSRPLAAAGPTALHVATPRRATLPCAAGRATQSTTVTAAVPTVLAAGLPAAVPTALPVAIPDTLAAAARNRAPLPATAVCRTVCARMPICLHHPVTFTLAACSLSGRDPAGIRHVLVVPLVFIG